jgi:hypothetical protein
MHIILGDDQVDQLQEKYTLLEVDQLCLFEGEGPIQAYCVLEHIPVDEIPKIEEFASLHKKLMENYSKKDWSFCEQALEHLQGRWGGQVDTFYEEIAQRIAKYKQEDPGADWTPVIQKY